jgi:hypothetical protein
VRLPVAVVVHLVGAAVEDVHGIICEVVRVGVWPRQHTHDHCVSIRGSLVNSTCTDGGGGGPADNREDESSEAVRIKRPAGCGNRYVSLQAGC